MHSTQCWLYLGLWIYPASLCALNSAILLNSLNKCLPYVFIGFTLFTYVFSVLMTCWIVQILFIGCYRSDVRCSLWPKKKSLNKNWNNFFFAKPFSAKGRSYCITECHIHSTLGRRVGFEFDGHRSPMAIQRNPLITIDRLHAFLIHRRLIDGGIMDGPGVSGSNHNTDGPRFHSGPRFAYSDLVIKPSQS